MNLEQSIATVIMSTIALAGLWFLIFWLYRDYRLDYFRDKLFALRDELFDMALRGEIDFNHPAYGLLRTILNGTIRYGHRLGLIEIIISIFSFREDKAYYMDIAKKFERHWSESVATLPHATKAALGRIRGRLHYLMAEQMILSQPILLVLIVPVLFLFLIKSLWGSIIRRFISDTVMSNLANRVDSIAFEAGK